MRRSPWMAAILSLSLATACGPKIPRKPASLPAEAAWVGEKATGAFVAIGERKGFGWSIRVWSQDGTLLKEAVFQVQGMARADVLPSEIAGWDGQTLSLKDGGRLVPQH